MSLTIRKKQLSEQKIALQSTMESSKDFDEQMKVRSEISLINLKLEVLESRSKGHWKKDHPETFMLIKRT